MSTLRVNTLQNAAGTSDPAISGAAKAWVNFNGTGTVAIRASFNVSSITDNGTGVYTVNFTNTLADANFSVVVTAGRNTTNGGGGLDGMFTTANDSGFQTTSGVQIQTWNYNIAAADSRTISVSVFD